jgi:hypothetical protein
MVLSANVNSMMNQEISVKNGVRGGGGAMASSAGVAGTGQGKSGASAQHSIEKWQA